MRTIRAGDTVTHGPSGETWLVAAVSDRELAPAGWPPTFALLADCVLVERCTDDEHREMVVKAAGHESARIVGASHTCDVCGSTP